MLSSAQKYGLSVYFIILVLLSETLVKSRSVPREQNHRLLLQDTPAVGKIRDESHFLTLSNRKYINFAFMAYDYDCKDNNNRYLNINREIKQYHNDDNDDESNYNDYNGMKKIINLDVKRRNRKCL